MKSKMADTMRVMRMAFHHAHNESKSMNIASVRKSGKNEMAIEKIHTATVTGADQ